MATTYDPATQAKIDEIKNMVESAVANHPEIQQQLDPFKSIDQGISEVNKDITDLHNFNLEVIKNMPYADQEQSAQLKPTNYSSSSQKYAVPQSYINVQKSTPSNYTGYVGNTPYVNGQVQTSGGGYYTDPTTGKMVYSAGYHGGGGGGWYEDRGQWGTGPNNGPIVNGTMQTGGGGFTPDGSYSAGYHGSGEHPEITGESTPGLFRSGSFGPVAKPDFSNGLKVDEYLRYLGKMGYGIDKYFMGNEGKNMRQQLEKDYNSNGGNYNSEQFVKSLSNPNPGKTDLLFSVNAQTPLKDVQSKLGDNFSKLFDNSLPAAPGLAKSVTSPAPTPAPASLNDLGAAVQSDFNQNYINPYSGTTTSYKRRYKLYR